MAPRRLMKSMAMPCWAGRRPRRSGLGDASCAAASGRTIQNSMSVSCAARCRRRSDSVRAWVCQNSIAPQLPLRKTCSALHKASAVEPALIHSRCSGGKPHSVHAAICGRCGGCTNAMRRFLPMTCNTGRSSRISPMPACCTSNSIMAAAGHPPCGKALSSSAKPEGKAAVR